MPKNWKIIVPAIFALALILIGYKNYGAGLFGSKTAVFRAPATADKSLNDFYRQSLQLTKPAAPATTTAAFLAVGDIMLSRNVAGVIKQSGDVDLPFKNMGGILKSTDFNFANLESPFYPDPGCNMTKGVIGGHSLIFGAPCDTHRSLIDNNFKVLNLANNHALDQGLAGIDFTRSLLELVNIQTEGAADNLDKAWTPAVVTANGIKICFIGASFSSLNDGGKATNNYVARIEDTARLQAAITTAKSECDFVVATMHAGTEYTRTPNDAQVKFAHAAIDDGADMVIGSHPHWVQTVEKYCPPSSPLPLGEGQGEGSKNCINPKYIFYSLGNFIFDQMWSQETKEGLALKVTVIKSKTTNPTAPGAAALDDLQGSRTPATLDSIELIPVIIENYSTPRPATVEESKKILDKIGEAKNILYP